MIATIYIHKDVAEWLGIPQTVITDEYSITGFGVVFKINKRGVIGETSPITYIINKRYVLAIEVVYE